MSSTASLLKTKTSLPSPSLSAMVKGKNSEGKTWKESTELISLSRTGTGFYLRQKCQIGQLLSLILPMPKKLRCYDREKELYRVWGLVQHCYRISGSGSNSNSYHVGIAFTGKNAPQSYHQNPFQSYLVVGINENGLWKITETKTPFVSRRYPRVSASLNVSLQVLDEKDHIVAEEKTVTSNISQRGAAVFSELRVSVGECIKFNCKKPDFSALAVVRSQKHINQGIHILHLEFVSGDFPIERLDFTSEN